MGEDGMVDGEWKKNAQVVGMRMVEVVIFHSKAGYQSVSEWRTLKLEKKLQEEKFGKEVARGEGKGTEKE